MKKILLVVGLLILSVGFVACDESENLNESPVLRVNDDLFGVNLTVVGEINRDSVVINLQLTNETAHSLTYGEPFSIEFYDEGVWRVFPIFEEAEFVSIGYSLAPNETSNFTRNLEWWFPDGLPYAGRYRLRMDIFNDADIPIREHHLHDLVAEFDVR